MPSRRRPAELPPLRSGDACARSRLLVRVGLGARFHNPRGGRPDRVRPRPQASPAEPRPEAKTARAATTACAAAASTAPACAAAGAAARTDQGRLNSVPIQCEGDAGAKGSCGYEAN